MGALALTANAQVSRNASPNDTTVNRQVLLEKNYNPTLKDASKINTIPEVYDPVVKKANVKPLDGVPQISITNNKLGGAQSGDIATDVAFDKKRGYLVLGAGNNSNMSGAAGYQILNSNTDQLNLFANHSSSSSDIDYANKDYLFRKMKGKYSDTKVNLKYAHTFDLSTLSVGGSFFNESYNYYGNSFILPSALVLPSFDYGARQNVDVISFDANIKSNDANNSLLAYKIGASYDNFKQKYAWNKDIDGPKGGIFKAFGDFSTPFDADRTLGLNIGFLNQSFSKDNLGGKDSYHSYNNISLSPYFNIEGEAFDVSLGVNMAYLKDVSSTFLLAPNVTGSYKVNEVSQLYAGITSAVNNNTFLDVLQENRYFNPHSRVGASKTYYDATVGFKSGMIEGFEFDIFGGYKYTRKDHLYVMGASEPTTMWGNLGTPIYANVNTGNFGAMVKTNLIPYTDLSARLTGYFYSVKYKSSDFSSFSGVYPTEKKAWGKPTFTAELNADVKVIPQLTLSVNYQYMGGRKAYVESVGSMKMKDVNELNFRGEYQILDWFSVSCRLNNVLGQKYELQQGYTLQGFNVLGGLSFKF